MPLNVNMETRPAKGSNYVTIKDMEELVLFARAQGATDDYILGVDVAMEFRTPARVRRAVIMPPTDD